MVMRSLKEGQAMLITDAERLSARILLAIADEKISDVRIALDLVERFMDFLGLGLDARLSDLKDLDERLHSQMKH
jgi:hypothetical protein